MIRIKFLTFIIIIFLCLNLTYADENTQHEYKIKNIDDLSRIKNDMDGNYILMNDLDLNGSSWNSVGKGKFFEGVFDGNGKTLSNFTICGNDEENVGFFEYVGEQGIVKNTVLKDIKISGGYFAGCIAGYNKGSIENCHAINVVVENKWGAGGLTGSSCGTIENCSFNGSVKSSNAGGITGINTGIIKMCYSDSNIEGESTAGGIAGMNFNKSIENIYALGTVKGGHYSGGITGANYDGGKIEYAYTLNRIIGQNKAAGGISGINKGYIENCIAINDGIDGNINMGAQFPPFYVIFLKLIYGDESSVGCITGGTDYDKIPTNCFSSNEIKTNKLYFNGFNGQKISKKEISEMFPTGIWNEWDKNIWKTNQTNLRLPVLIWQ
ncbi:MAG: hypothetical protein RBQ94_06250 [Methanimicrococcus sp.]|nr:hypothetical protein [Methanimicrococcus sp.]